MQIEAKNISIEKDTQISIFEGEVIVRTEDGNSITSDYAKYNREEGFIELKKNVLAKDKKNNIIKSDYIYTENIQILKTKGPTSITTTENYRIYGSDIIFDNISKFIRSDKKTIIEDIDNNRIFLDNFEYLIDNNIFKSIVLINIEDNLKNNYEFSQIYIDTKKKEILGTDIKLNLNSKDFKINEDNKPRILANTVQINENKKSFGKSIFTICDTDQMISVHLGLFKPLKCFMITKRKQFIMIMP